jgi:hypothetical protein
VMLHILYAVVSAIFLPIICGAVEFISGDLVRCWNKKMKYVWCHRIKYIYQQVGMYCIIEPDKM